MMRNRITWTLSCAVAGLAVLGLVAGAALAAEEAAPTATAAPAKTGAIKVTLVKKDDGSYTLMREGKPYFIKGAGGDASKKTLAELGGNSFRTWGIGKETQGQLDEAQKLGLTVTLGTWLGHKSYFSYTKEDQNAEQKARVKREVEQYKDNPVVLLWALGNEMESGFEGDAAIPVWKHIQELAKMVHEIDPNHPTMTVVAELGGDKVKMIHELCPDIDIVGINSYAGCGSIAKRYVDGGGTKPYIITEFGPPGVWECAWMKDKQGLMREFNSTEKAKWYSDAYKGSIIPEGHPLSLGCYTFAWGSKQEATATWYGLIMSDGSHTQAVDVLSEFWTGKPPAVRAPIVKGAKIEGVDPAVGCVVQPGGIVKASAEIEDPQGLPITYKWSLTEDAMNYNTGGENQAAPPAFPLAILKNGAANVEVRLPRTPKAYRLYLFAYNGKGGVATLNFPIKAEGEVIAETPEEKAEMEQMLKGKEAKLPVTVYAEDGEKWLWNPTGFMGSDVTVMSIDAKCTDNPHAGKTCMKFFYNSGQGWGGVVWQDPDNDWGALPGGYNLTGAKTLSFWARGAKGGEKASFGLGLLKKDAKKPANLFVDTATAEMKDVILTPEWKQYSIDLEGKDLSHIKTGFWFVTGPTATLPTTFYLDDIVISAESSKPVETPAATPTAAPAAEEKK
jgi:hypothetical protein